MNFRSTVSITDQGSYPSMSVGHIRIKEQSITFRNQTVCACSVVT